MGKAVEGCKLELLECLLVSSLQRLSQASRASASLADFKGVTFAGTVELNVIAIWGADCTPFAAQAINIKNNQHLFVMSSTKPKINP